MLDGILSLHALIEADESNPSRQTCGLVHQDPGVDDAPEAQEHVLHVLLGHGLRQATDVQVGVLNALRARPSVRHLRTANRVQDQKHQARFAKPNEQTEKKKKKSYFYYYSQKKYSSDDVFT